MPSAPGSASRRVTRPSSFSPASSHAPSRRNSPQRSASPSASGYRASMACACGAQRERDQGVAGAGRSRRPQHPDRHGRQVRAEVAPVTVGITDPAIAARRVRHPRRQRKPELLDAEGIARHPPGARRGQCRPGPPAVPRSARRPRPRRRPPRRVSWRARPGRCRAWPGRGPRRTTRSPPRCPSAAPALRAPAIARPPPPRTETGSRSPPPPDGCGRTTGETTGLRLGRRLGRASAVAWAIVARPEAARRPPRAPPATRPPGPPAGRCGCVRRRVGSSFQPNPWSGVMGGAGCPAPARIPPP
jgi:hypothetical protein